MNSIVAALGGANANMSKAVTNIVSAYDILP